MERPSAISPSTSSSRSVKGSGSGWPVVGAGLLDAAAVDARAAGSSAGSASPRAYSTACSGVIARPSVHAASSSWERAATRCASGSVGTAIDDYLIGGPEDREPFGAFDRIWGFEGNDVYNGGNGSDVLTDESTTSSDVYIFPSTQFSTNLNGLAIIWDFGGAGDIVVLSSYDREDFELSRIDDKLILDGPGGRDIRIANFFGEGEIEYFLFRDGWISGDELTSPV